MEKVRISKLMSEQGICSRREADQYIEQGLVLVDGEVVNELGARAFPHQKIELKKAAVAQQARRYTIILNKPWATFLILMKIENTNQLLH